MNLTDRLPEVAVYVVHLEDPPGSGRAACCGLLLPRLPEVGIRWGCSGCLRLAATSAPHSIGGVLHNHRHSERPDCGERVVGDCLTATPVPLDVVPEAAVMGTDARLWASEFVRLFGNDPDEGTMLGWFANAIEAGRAATPAPLDGRIAAMKLPMVEPVGSKKTDAINSQRASWNAALDAAAREFATPAPLDVERLADALPLGEPTMHAHDGLGIHRAEAHHRPEDYRP